MTPAIADTQVRDYLDAVRARLGDLDPEEREHLLSDTEASLLEAAGDEAALPLEVRLGPPEHFARELRAAAGLPEEPSRAARASLLARLAAHRRVTAARGVARELVPAWWLVRAFVALSVVAQLLGDDWSVRYPIFTSVLGGPLGWVLLLGAVAGSVALGRRERAATRRWPLVLNVALGLAAAWLLVAMAGNAGADRATDHAVVFVETPSEGLVRDGHRIGNIYPYDRRGRLLQDVRLFDETGTPLAVRHGEALPRRVPVDRTGERLFNAFPIRYFEEGTRKVRRPGAGGLAEQPRAILTPPLGGR
jgi:uncharacterized membrane protein